ncbi:MAG TPA: prefoldin subunit alpha [Nitrosopumilaceae archaeon]|nr:prefoldin subunit alpha [Nitrosopumilaceae archaeon]
MSEEQAQQLLYQMQMLESYFGELTQKENTLMNVLKDTKNAIDSLKELGNIKESNTLLPIGMGTFVKSKILSEDKIVLNVGAGVAIEKDKDSAINFLESRIKEIEVALQESMTQKQNIAAQLEQGKAEMNRLAQSESKQNK